MISDLQTYVVAASVSSAVSSAASALASATAALRCSAVILVGLPASTLASSTARRICSSAAILSPGGIVIVCHDLGELLQLGVAP